MKISSKYSEERKVPGKLLLPSLTLSRFALQPPLLIASLLLLDMALSFDQPVGVMGQMRTTAALVAAIAAVFGGAWSVRFNHKSLLMIGLLICFISALGCFLAINFSMLLVAYALSGLGFAMTDPMLYTLVGEYFPIKKRARAVGWILTGAALAGIIGTPIIGFIVGIWGWRIAFLGFSIPIALLSLVMTAKVIPSSSSSQNRNPSISKGQYVEGFKRIFSNKSAAACLVATTFSYASWQAVVLYGVSFIRQRFLVSLTLATFIVLGISSCFILGSQMGGHIVNKFGRKPVVAFAVFFVGILIIVFTNLMYLWLALAFMFLDAWFDGVRATAGNSLSLEQIPQFRGSMMALNSAAWNIGNALGAGLGGLALLWADYEGLGFCLGAMGITAALIYYLLTIDPTSPEVAKKVQIAE